MSYKYVKEVIQLNVRERTSFDGTYEYKRHVSHTFQSERLAVNF